jgi:hypothetical protein
MWTECGDKVNVNVKGGFIWMKFFLVDFQWNINSHLEEEKKIKLRRKLDLPSEKKKKRNLSIFILLVGSCVANMHNQHKEPI